MTPCDQLSADELHQRLAALMFKAGVDVRIKSHLASRERVPGFCVICGAKLPVTWRATKVDRATGKTVCIEADHSPGKLANVEAFKAKYPPDEVGMRNGYLLRAVTQCEAINEEAWNAAAALVKAQAREAKSAPAREKEKRRNKAATKLGGEA